MLYMLGLEQDSCRYLICKNVTWMLQVSTYKGEKKPKFVPNSQLEKIRKGEQSEYYNEATLQHFANSLDLHWEQRAGFNYDGVFAQAQYE